jgi:DNA polymerase delta subunit 4
MPRGRKSAGARSASGGQSTLSFNNRVTKPSTSAQRQEQAASAKKLSHLEDTLSQQSEPETTEVQVKDEPESTQHEGPEDDEHSETEQIVEEEPEPSRAGARRKVKAVKGKDERELAAEKISDAQLKKYWQAEEDSRLAPRGMVNPVVPASLTL